MEINVNVDQECIDTGLPGHDKTCPVALALLGTARAPNHVSVGTDTVDIRWSIWDDIRTYALPFNVQSFIRCFDDPRCNELWRTTKPFAFTLDTIKALLP